MGYVGFLRAKMKAAHSQLIYIVFQTKTKTSGPTQTKVSNSTWAHQIFLFVNDI